MLKLYICKVIEGEEKLKTRTIEQQYQHLKKKKGIEVRPSSDKKKFKAYNYYQVVNAYKYPFVFKAYDYNQIKNIILNPQTITYDFILDYYDIREIHADNEKIEKVAKKILEKYDLYDKRDSIQEMELKISKLDYVLHKYEKEAKYSDFIRLYKFEHELRSVLLKYMLKLEENIKNIVCVNLADREVKPNFLLSRESYDIKNSQSVIKSIKMVYDKLTVKNNSIQRKNDQEITPPFWIIIPAMTFNELIVLIFNLDTVHKVSIIDALVEKLTINSLSGDSAVVEEKKENFVNMLRSVGQFRNKLAHNEPLLTYNLKGKKWNKQVNHVWKEKREDKRAISPSERYDLIDEIFSCNHSSSISNQRQDLAYMIFVIGKFIISLDKNSRFHEDVKKCFYEFHIVENFDFKYETVNKTEFSNIKEKIDLLKNEVDLIMLEDIENSATNSLTFKRKIRSSQKAKESIDKYIKAIDIILHRNLVDDRKYKALPRTVSEKYYAYTGINLTFLENFDK